MNIILRGASALLLLSTVTFARSEVSNKPQCQAGKIQCVHHVIKEMDRRFRKLTKSCDHDAIFSLVYLRTTEKYEETAEDLGYEDVSSITREDALFADYYFRAYDAYHSGTGTVPPAWQVAFDAAENKAITSVGNALLGFNAHIQRDIPYVLYDLYLEGNEISEFDHFKVNEFLAQVDVVDEIIERFDDTYPTGGSSELVYWWRELAWNNYRALVEADDEAERAAISAQIEQTALETAWYFASMTAYADADASEARDAYCEENAKLDHHH